MASMYTQLKKGSSGNQVNALQAELSKKGYTLQNTGLFDDATEAALRQYQQENGLEVSGIANDATLGKLYGPVTKTGTGYSPSGKWVEAQKYAEHMQTQKPGEYKSAYTDKLQAQFDAIMNRQPFQYDAATDPAFQQMTDLYMQQGRRAMQDTMGQAAAMTGGYGNSWAQYAGQQAYGDYMQGLNALAPEYMQQAYNRYQNEGAEMLDRFNLLQSRDESDYGRYVDQVNQYYADLDRAQQAADNLYSREYGEHQDTINWKQTLAEFQWQQQVAREQMALQREQMAMQQAMQQAQMAFQQQQYADQMAAAEKEWAFQQQQYQDQLNSENREYAYKTAMSLLGGGQMPSADLLAAAGLSSADAATLMGMYAPKTSSGSGGSSGGRTGTTTYTPRTSNSGIAANTAGAVAAMSGIANMAAGMGAAANGASDIMTYNQWNAQNKGANSSSAPYGNTSAGNMDSYEDYVSKTIEDDYKNGKLSVLDVLKRTAQYLPSKK